ncbi:hypothetical protein BDQ17DRAFT_1337369 [Cyathus striatus]|nr:hypothetical protein BDQ17DRAFT_1337369 [Cyathus striatus]
MTSDHSGLPDVIISPPPPMPTADRDGSSDVNQSDAGGTPEHDFGEEHNDMYHASETSPMPTVLWSSSSGMSPENDTPMKDLLSSAPFDNPTGLDAEEGDVGVLIFPDGSIGGSVIPSPSNILDVYSSNGETPEDPSGISEGLSATEPPILPSGKISKASFPAASSPEPYIFPCSSNLTPSAQYHSHSSRMNNGSSMSLAERVLMLLSKLKAAAPTPQELQNSGGSTVYTHIDPITIESGQSPCCFNRGVTDRLGDWFINDHIDHPSSSHLLSKVSEAPVTPTEEPQLDLGIGSPNQHLNNHPLPKNSYPAYSPLQRLVLNPKADIKLFLEENIHIPIQVKEKDVASIGVMGTIFIAYMYQTEKVCTESDSGGEVIHDGKMPISPFKYEVRGSSSLETPFEFLDEDKESHIGMFIKKGAQKLSSGLRQTALSDPSMSNRFEFAYVDCLLALEGLTTNSDNDLWSSTGIKTGNYHKGSEAYCFLLPFSDPSDNNITTKSFKMDKFMSTQVHDFVIENMKRETLLNIDDFYTRSSKMTPDQDEERWHLLMVMRNITHINELGDKNK